MPFQTANIPDFFPLLLAAAGVSMALLALSWVLSMGFVRGSLAALCRIGWLLPLFVSFFPETQTEQLPRTLTLKPVHVLLDDSESMKGDDAKESSGSILAAKEMLKKVEDECVRLGCIPKVTRLSEQDEDVKLGFTPLSNVLDSWVYKVGADPWLLISDGGDYRPTEHWHPSLKGAGLPEAKGKTPRGLIVGFGPKAKDNIWIKDYDVAPFSFEDKPLTLSVTLKRTTARTETERVQVQILTGDTPLATVNGEFKPGDLEAQIGTTIPPLPKGQHLLTIRALPTADETALWDNTVHTQVEVMPNTVGVLHLLGSPSWDGRFLRRYLKSEPKYDLISFFILRDPWDSQQVNERELSLIPFPVERLFREELPNFRVVVIQNFTLFQFLLPEYQNNLVKFVQDGGGLLFIGGPRALTSSDLSSSPLRAILPFEVDGDSAPTAPGGFDMTPFGDDMAQTPQVDDKGPAYDPDTTFKIEMARPEPAKRALANVYEDWEALADPLSGWKTAKGLHHMERVKFKADSTTILLNAKVGKRDVPLAVASYPGKGRALWVFSDSLWRLGLTPSDQTSRQVYNQFMRGAMTWLMRQDLRKPLVAKNFTLHGGRKMAATFRATIQGPAARYFQPSPEWKLTVCGNLVAPDKLTVTKHSSDEWEIAGPMPVNLAGGARCTLDIEGAHAAFGSVKASITSVFPEVYKDSEIDAAPQKLEELAALTGATLAIAKVDEPLDAWIAGATGQDGVSLPNRFKTLRNFFWILDTPWFWLLLILMPMEVVIRRWEQLFAQGGRLKDKELPQA